MKIRTDHRGNLFTSLSYDDVLLVPQKGVLEHREDADLTTYLVRGMRMKLLHPILAANMPSVTEAFMALSMWGTGGWSFLHRFCSIEENVLMYQQMGMSAAGISLGISEGLERYQALSDEGADCFLVDVAHAHSVPVLKFVEQLMSKKEDQHTIIVGNVVTPEAVEDIQQLGVDAIKVGIGPGAACSTREVAGSGRGQISALLRCSEVTEVPLIADGGIRNSGDIVKALAAGASTVMVGRLLAGCTESPFPGHYWGNASHRMNKHQAPEGVEGEVLMTGSLENTLKPLLWGIRSGISYCGAQGISDLAQKAVFERVAPGVAGESSTRI
jgi:IMP dehydrogenase